MLIRCFEVFCQGGIHSSCITIINFLILNKLFDGKEQLHPKTYISCIRQKKTMTYIESHQGSILVNRIYPGGLSIESFTSPPT